jgi:hypothetical protein
MFTITKAHNNYSFFLLIHQGGSKWAAMSKFNLIGNICPTRVSAVLAYAFAQGVPMAGLWRSGEKNLTMAHP